MTYEIIMIRHAQSTWNAESRFTGWANPPLTQKGELEAVSAAELLGSLGYSFDKVYTSALQRAQKTALIITSKLGLRDVDIEADWRLNERHYGDLQGLDKNEMTSKVGEEQVWRWRRAYKELPPALEQFDRRHPSNDPSYSQVDREKLPGAENLAMTQARAMQFWQEKVASDLSDGKRLLISAHGNTLRAMIMQLSGMTEKEVEGFEIPTGTPISYCFDKSGKALSWSYVEAHKKVNCGN